MYASSIMPKASRVVDNGLPIIDNIINAVTAIGSSHGLMRCRYVSIASMFLNWFGVVCFVRSVFMKCWVRCCALLILHEL
ncbi:hypothetical protein [Staphylothermus hellenicus]|uniref:hypothetical protein n=1 Tax=Staphylothermus hellenicus TaxID=84599 RepID=UPI000699E560|nr:hypothetical protein [Staphylothermus hellenicus]